MKCELLNISAIKEIYYEYLVNDFPADEVKPFNIIEMMYNNDKYFAYGFFAEDRLVAYALFVGKEGDDVVLLDYFAVVKKFRQNGYGTEFLKQLKKLMSGSKIILEAEDDKYAHDDNDKYIRQRRLSFYESAGASDTGIRALVFGVHYIIFVCDEDYERGYIEKALRDIYAYMFEPHFSDKYKVN